MSKSNKKSFSALLKKYEDLPEDLAIHIESLLETVELPRKTILLKAGKVCDYLYFMERGMARNYFTDEGKELTNDIVIEGELLVSFSSFISREPSNESIELIEDSILHAIHYNDLQELYRTYPIMERIGRKMAEYHYNSLASRTYRLKFSSSAERYDYLFKNKIEIIRRAPIGIIASYLGMTFETLSRIRSNYD
ncbi:MAG: Crp/Fnr family transcriptional regulator [Sphingobacteriales bacterium]|jgi:CRP-like cAMP-binding protein|nr:Crp/Fnr family transcriptional regulator [Sphingobacteriales bacterium]